MSANRLFAFEFAVKHIAFTDFCLLLKLSAKFEKNPIVKLFVLPGLFFQLFSTREPEDEMIETAISSLSMVINKGENLNGQNNESV